MTDRIVFGITTGVFTAGWFGALSLATIYNDAAGFGVWAVTLTAWLATRTALQSRRHAAGRL